VKKQKFKKGDLVLIIDPTIDWGCGFLSELLFNSIGVVTHTVGDKCFVTQASPRVDGAFNYLFYSEEALEKIPTNYTFEDVL